ncbi:hypothetical protein GGR56DRAFT_686775 [Xylariaceae sp. FL0804]|nr:hypothetical protein GGR56DRAFT_686775 [Xylariaceae sp. FL0804]
MAPEHESTGVLGSLASSVKSMVAGQPAAEEKTHIEVVKDVEYPELPDSATAVQEVEKTEEVVQEDTTTIHKEQAAAVVHEDVKPEEIEQVDTVVDREIHQDHFHTTVVPVKDTKVLPQKHVYQENEAEREIDHRNNAVKKAAQKESEAIHNEKVIEETKHAREVAPTQIVEHVHHHIHETIQPVIERETIQEKIIHVTNHVHETEHLKDQLHKTTVAPAISMADFEKQLAGKAELTEGATLVADEDEEEEEEIESAEEEEELAQQGESGEEYMAPSTRRSTRSTKEISVAIPRKSQNGNAKKRHAPTDGEAEDLEPAAKAGKLAA